MPSNESLAMSRSLPPMIAGLAARVADLRFVRYVLVSIGALAVDMGTFLACLSFGMIAAPASAVGYGLGILAHWLLSSRTVFADRVAADSGLRMRQKALFLISALTGLAITVALVGGIEGAGGDPRLAKAVAIVVSFLVTYWLRKRVVFG